MIAIRLREAIKAYRQRTGEYLTYKKLAQRTGLSINTLDSIMSPTRPYNATLHTIHVLCHALRCTPAMLLAFHKETKEPGQAEGHHEAVPVAPEKRANAQAPEMELPAAERLPRQATDLTTSVLVLRLREAMTAYRQRTGEYLTYTKLAHRTGLGLSTLQGLGSKRPSNTTLRVIDHLCQALQCTPADLIALQWHPEEASQAEHSTEKFVLSTRNASSAISSDASRPSEWILQVEAARLRGVPRQSISRLVQAGRLTTRVIDGRPFVRRADILALPPPPPGHRKTPEQSEP